MQVDQHRRPHGLQLSGLFGATETGLYLVVGLLLVATAGLILFGTGQSLLDGLRRVVMITAAVEQLPTVAPALMNFLLELGILVVLALGFALSIDLLPF